MSLRTVQYWDAGKNRVPWSVVRLLRLLRTGDLGALRDDWDGWTLDRLGLHDPAGRTYRLDAMRHWWLTCEQARFWRQSYALACDSERLEGASTFAPKASGQGADHPRETATADGSRVDAVPADRSPSGASAAALTVEASPRRAAVPAGRRARATVATPGRRGRWGKSHQGAGRSAPAGAGLVSSSKQVGSEGQESSNGAASKGRRHAR